MEANIAEGELFDFDDQTYPGTYLQPMFNIGLSYKKSKSKKKKFFIHFFTSYSIQS